MGGVIRHANTLGTYDLVFLHTQMLNDWNMFRLVASEQIQYNLNLKSNM
jgi:bacterioferritin (cytochrome b1)